MGTSIFLTNKDLWKALRDHVEKAKRVDVAMAYVGNGGHKLLPLGRGDRLVVDMSLGTVKAGATDPYEIEIMVKRGVSVFTRGNLHAKVLVADKSVIAASSNISVRSQNILDEAGILTTDVASVRRAREFINKLCTEPVRPEYLKECKRAYKPPRVSGKSEKGMATAKRTSHAKLWFVCLHEGVPVPESELRRYERGETRAIALVMNPSRTTTDSFHWPHRPKMADVLQGGDWIIQSIKSHDGSISVHTPAQLLYIDHYVRDRDTGKERWVFHLETVKRGEKMSWAKYRQKASRILKLEEPLSWRTRSIKDIGMADQFLGIWTPAGKISKSK